ncbi:dTMP kinase [Vibrio crassostreae]|uniref:dTMP kinase n=1 Tax=Vibrio crassostreae TaxID=246167 RepID=UPI001B305527|nr:dTMP kinase [Vibrio crassostreae]
MYIEFEGAEGAYKSTIIDKVMAKLNEKAIPCENVRQPGGTEYAELFREILKYGVKGINEELTPESMLHLALAARSQLMLYVVKPLLEKGVVTLSDRGNLSSIALQGFGSNVNLDLIESSIKNSEDIIKSDLMFYIDISLETSLQRQGKRGTTDKIEDLGDDFQSRALEGMRTYSNDNVYTHSRIDISGYKDSGEEKTSTELAEEISKIIIERYDQRQANS